MEISGSTLSTKVMDCDEEPHASHLFARLPERDGDGGRIKLSFSLRSRELSLEEGWLPRSLLFPRGRRADCCSSLGEGDAARFDGDELARRNCFKVSNFVVISSFSCSLAISADNSLDCSLISRRAERGGEGGVAVSASDAAAAKYRDSGCPFFLGDMENV